jgi:hypothetical protein
VSQQRSESMLVCEHHDPAIVAYRLLLVVVSKSGDDHDDDQLEVAEHLCALLSTSELLT